MQNEPSENTVKMKITTRLETHKIILILLFGVILKLCHLFTVSNGQQIEKNKFIFDEKPILGENVKYYTKEELLPGYRKPAKVKKIPGEGGKPVIASKEGIVLKLFLFLRFFIFFLTIFIF